jgi:hypothetical protein
MSVTCDDHFKSISFRRIVVDFSKVKNCRGMRESTQNKIETT